MREPIGLRLEALDVLFFRDGRPFTAASRGASGLPAPQTMAGALRTVLLERYGCNFERLRGPATFAAAVQQACSPEHHWIGKVVVRGPWIARWNKDKPDEVEVLTPMPAVLHTEKKHANARFHRLQPLKDRLPGWRPAESGLRPLWLRERVATESAEGYLTPKGLADFLRGQEVEASAVVTRDALFAFDHRTGIGIEPDRLSVEESQIYGVSFLALKDGVGLYVEVVLPDGAPADAL